MKILKGVVNVISVILYWACYQLWLPTMSMAHYSGYSFIAFGVVLFWLNFLLWFPKIDTEKGSKVAKIITASVIGFTIVFAISGGIGSTAIFHSDEMFEQIGTIEKKSFTEDIVQIDNSQIPVVDIELAQKLADKRLGEDTTLGSVCRVGDFTNKQSVNGKLVYVAPLEHSGFFKWNKNKSGTTGYVIVSATNATDIQLVQEVDGKALKLKYLSSSYFGDDLKRYLRYNGYSNVGMTDYTFELDDNGYPYWVITTFENTTFWRNPEATGVIVFDPQTGKDEWYSVEDTPEWVDIIQPESFVANQLWNWGSLPKGWWNPSCEGEMSVTPHITTVYNNGDCYYYTGMSSVGADQGTVGFVMVNSRDKSAIMYEMSGATEEAAMKSAEGEVTDMGYKATTPIPLNVSGIPTYFCTLKDPNEGLVKAYALINISNYDIANVADSIMEVKRAYINNVNTSNNTQALSGDETFGYSLEGIVTRLGSNIENGNTYYYMILNNNSNQIFLASYLLSEELPVTREGDKVKVSYVDEKATGAINIVEFDNMNFNLNESEKSNIIEMKENNITNVDPKVNQKVWENLTDEEKSKLLENLE